MKFRALGPSDFVIISSSIVVSLYSFWSFRDGFTEDDFVSLFFWIPFFPFGMGLNIVVVRAWVGLRKVKGSLIVLTRVLYVMLLGYLFFLNLRSHYIQGCLGILSGYLSVLFFYWAAMDSPLFED